MDFAVVKVKPSDHVSWSSNMAFGVIPLDIVELLKQMGDDRIVKMRCLEDLDQILVALSDPKNELELIQLLNYSSSFIQFVEEHILND